MRCYKIASLFRLCAFPMILAVPCSAARFGSLANGQAETFVPFVEGNFPEGIAIHKDVMYVSNSYPTGDGLVPEVLRIDPDGDVSVLTTFDPTSNPEAFGGLGAQDGLDPPPARFLLKTKKLEPSMATSGGNSDLANSRFSADEDVFHSARDLHGNM